MKCVIRHVILAALFVLPFATPALAQYMYLDSNGDGVWSTADDLSPNGTATSVDVWINTNHNRDGSLAVCDTGDGDLGTWNSYSANLLAVGGTVTFGTPVNQQPSFTIQASSVTSSTELTFGRATGSPEPAGLERMFSVTITGATGAPSITIIPYSTLGPDPTSFGTPCSGRDFDNTYKLGSDWTDVDGLGAAAVADLAPTVTAPATVSGTEGTLITITVTALDPDADAITSLTTSALPTGATFTPNATNTSGTFSWTPSSTQSGTYPITFTAANALTGTATTTITVANLDQAPVVTAPATVSGTEGTLITFTVTASDADGDAITSLTTSALPTGAIFTPNATNTSGTFSWTPSDTQSGTYPITFTAANTLTGTATTTITVANADQAPVVTAPATASGASGELITFTVTASDPDGDAITSLTTSALPTGATFTPNATNTSGTFSWTPSLAQIGETTITFTASNALSGTATTTITVTSGDHAPVVTAPTTATGAEGTLITFVVTASDADGDPITSLTTSALPTGAIFTPNATNTSGTFEWTPASGDAGTYPITFTASNALSGSAVTTVTVTGVDQAPVVTAPATVSGTEGVLITFTVTASDPDGDAITSLTTSALPTGAIFTPNATNTSGTFSWTPDATQSGTYPITFTATNALTGTATTTITVGDVDAAPVVTAPATISGAEGSLITFTVTASDPDGDAITSLTSSVLPTGATFVTDPTNTSGTFVWTPATGDAGSYPITFTATNALTGTATTLVTVTGVNQNPDITAPATQSVDEGSLLTFTVSATDPDGGILTLAASGLPTGATFNDNGDNTGTFTWTPDPSQAGTFTVTFTATDAQGGTDVATTVITVNDVNGPPTAAAGGPYSGVINVAVQFDGSGSTDPDGDSLTYMWDFGDGSTGSGVDATHTYTAAATYTVTLTVTDPAGLSDSDVTTAVISGEFLATAFTVGGNKVTMLNSGKPYTCVQIEPAAGFSSTDIVLSSITMVSVGTGSVSEISAISTKTALDGDRDSDGISEVTACFAKSDLRLLFGNLAAGRQEVTVTIEGTLTSGAPFTATTTLIVKSTGSPLAATISPNPLNPKATLSFATSKPGALRVQMYDPQGRLVKTIADEATAAAGYHDYTVDGVSASGSKLASGVYFLKIWTQHDGQEVMSLTILK